MSIAHFFDLAALHHLFPQLFQYLTRGVRA